MCGCPQVVGHRHALFKYPSLKVHAADALETTTATVSHEEKECKDSAASQQLQNDVAELHKTVQLLLQAQQQINSRVAALAPGGATAPLHLPPLDVPPSSRLNSGP